ncbi:hypothetical protein NDU88_005357 [Pleurodeles waltl]|uniref:Reverse transcriptase domain-containing protein n=1 Tax=Pleurodeles waltl TaxID=8319 RepID=A0AAV7VNA4_PLEWA|nr:hypothetical protein NDU88_005357 [Pleurodeles waltl]
MARNRKAAMQTGGGSPAQQEALDHMEEMVAAAIPEEIVTGIQGQDSADYQDTMHMQEKTVVDVKADCPQMESRSLPMLLYADDAILMAKTAKGLQFPFSNLMAELDLSVNEKKSFMIRHWSMFH